MIGIIFGIFGLLASPIGFMAFGVGIVLFVLGPMVPRMTNRFHFLSRLHTWLGAQMLSRAAIVVSEHGDLLLKRMSPTDIGTERIYFKDTIKEFEDPHQAKSWWASIPFALADEKHGVLFDPRDAAIGAKEKALREADELVVKATEREREMYNVGGWQNAVYEFPANVYDLVNLNDFRNLISGIERAEHPQRVRKFYEYSRAPYEEGTSATRFILLLIALIGPFAALWLIATQLDGGNSSVSYGLLALVPSVAFLNRKKLKTIGVGLVVFGWPVALFAFLFLLTSPIYAVSIMVIMGAGFWLVPILSQLFSISGRFADSLGPLLIKSGLMGYELPVFELTTSGYKLREGENLETTEDVTWHSLLGRKFGFTFTPSSEMWDLELANPEEIKSSGVDDSVATNIPHGYSKIPERVRAGTYGSLVPSNVDDSKIYLWSGIALSKLAHVATGKKSHERLVSAKEEHGDVSGMSDKTVVIAMSLLSIVSFGSGVFIFFL